LKDIDKLDIECGAICNLIKDSRINRETTSQMYPQYGAFKSKLEEYDPEKRFSSALSERIFYGKIL
ncbi:MAG: hypothetical protein AAF549_09500, partial [Pseudomonadota bacterium]